MYCPKCGRVIPDDAKFCTFCGADMEPAPRHAKPGPVEEEEIYSYSDDNMPRDIDEQRFNDTRVFDPAQGAMEETKVYDFGMFEEHPADGYDQEPLPYGDEYSGDVDPRDSYEMYQDGEDDDTFMDKLDNKFRRYDDEEDDEPKKKNLLWLWISIIAFLLVLLILFGILLFTGALSKNKNNNAAATTSSAVATTAPTTAKATTPAATAAPQTEKPTEAPETQAPATQPPATQAPAPTEAPAPVVTNPPETEAPTPVPVSSEEEDDNEEEDASAINSREPIN